MNYEQRQRYLVQTITDLLQDTDESSPLESFLLATKEACMKLAEQSEEIGFFAAAREWSTDAEVLSIFLEMLEEAKKI